MDLQVKTHKDGAATQVKVAEKIFNCPFNEGLIHQAVVAYMAAGRQGTKAQKTRRMVRGGGAKPWRQKGTGRARAGTIRSPLWRGGGKIFAAVPRDYSQKVNRRVYTRALSSILSELIRQERLQLIDQFQLDTNKTQDLAKKLNELKLENVLIITGDIQENLQLAARNLPHVQVTDANRIDPVNLISYEKVLMTVEALKKIEEKLA